MLIYISMVLNPSTFTLNYHNLEVLTLQNMLFDEIMIDNPHLSKTVIYFNLIAAYRSIKFIPLNRNLNFISQSLNFIQF